MLSLSPSRTMKSALAAVAVTTALGMAVGEADARPGKGFSFGSRGNRTYQAPPPTATAPGAAAPMQKSITQPGQPSAAQAARPGVGAAAAQAAPRSNMMRNLLLGGLIGAGLASIFGVGAFASVMGFLLQTLLIGGLIYMAIAFFRNRRTAAAGGAPSPAAYTSAQRSAPEQARYATATAGAGVGGAAAANARPAAGTALQIGGADFETFERLLGEIQTAYGNEDRPALETRLTPEMLSYFVEELGENAKRGILNKISGVKLLQGDLSEAWTEGKIDYATVAMRYAITDVTVDRKTGRTVEGGEPGEATEVWTFARRTGSGPSGWELSAIQQA